MLLDPFEAGSSQFNALYVIQRVGVARGVLEIDQPAASAALTLSPTSGCPALAVICGFSTGVTALIGDRDGRFEVFTIGTTSPVAHTLTPSHPLSDVFAAGSLVVEVEAYRYALHPQADGSMALARTTVAGAVQPIVDEVVEVLFEGLPDPGALRRVDIQVRISARSDLPLRRVPDRTFRTSVALRSGL